MERRVPGPERERGRFSAARVALALAASCALLLIALPRSWFRGTGGGERDEVADSQLTRGGERDDLERQLWRILREPRVTAHAHEARVAELAALGPEAVPLLFSVLCQGPLEDRTLIEALVRLPRRPVLEHLRGAATGEAPLEPRLVAARVLGRIAEGESLEILLEVAAGIDPPQLEQVRVRRCIEGALIRILRGHPEAILILQRDLLRLPEPLLPIVARSLPAGRHALGLEVLFDLLDRDPSLDAVVLERVSSLAGSPHDSALDGSLWRVRGLTDSPDWEVRRGSALALGHLQDPTSVPQLIRMLEDPDPRVGQSALWALRNLSERRLGGDPRRWTDWYEGERAWFETVGSRLVEDLRSEDPEAVVAAAARLCRRPLYRHTAAAVLGPLLGRGDPRIARAIAPALQRTGSRRAVPYLVPGLQHPDPEVARAAHAALEALTGLSLPPEREVWELEVLQH